MDARTISGSFIGYLEKSNGYMFYCPNHSMRIIETGNARFIKNDEISGVQIHEMWKLKKLECKREDAGISKNVRQM